MAGGQVGEINVRLDADTKGLEAGAKRGKNALGQFEKGAKKAGTTSDKTTKSINGMGSGAVTAAKAVGALAISMGAVAAARGAASNIIDFDKAMKGLQATMNGSTADMAKLEDQARSLGASTVFSATEAANGQRFLAQAGFEVNEIISATPGILNLAIAGNLDLASAADIASNVLGGMRLEISELNRVNNVMASTAQSSNTNIQQLGQALAYAAPIAATAGVSIEEASAAIGTLSDAGIQGTKAGTGLLGVIRQLSKITPQAQEALDSYGLKSKDVNIETLGLVQVLDNLKQANIDTTDSFTIFGSEANAAASILSSGAGRVDTFTESLKDSEGAADKMAGVMSSSVDAALKGFGSAITEITLVIGEKGGKSGMLAAIEAATSLTRDFGKALSASAEISKSSASDFDGVSKAMRVIAVGLKGGIELMEDWVDRANLMVEMQVALYTGDWGSFGTIWDEYKAKLDESIDSTKAFSNELLKADKLAKEIGAPVNATKLTQGDVGLDLGGEVKDDQGDSSVKPKAKADGGKSDNKDSVGGDWRSMLDEQTAVFDKMDELELEKIAKEKDAFALKLERLEEGYLSENELLKADIKTKKDIADKALLDREIGLEEHEGLMASIRQEGADAQRNIDSIERKQKMAGAQDMMGALSGLMNAGSKELFEIGKVAALSNAAITGGLAIMDAWGAGMSTGGPWAPVVAAAYAGAATVTAATNISNISSQSYGGGATASGAASFSGGSQVVNTQQQQAASAEPAARQDINISATGDTFSRASVIGIIDGINEAVGDGARIKVT